MYSSTVPCNQKYISEPDLEKQIRGIIKKAAIPQAWADDWYKRIEEDEVREKQLAEENINNLREAIKLLDKKLSILLDSYLDQVIDAETYKLKKNEFFNEKLKIEEEITKIKTDGSSWLLTSAKFST